jgi:predicted ATP-dependent Lon-type protease
MEAYKFETTIQEDGVIQIPEMARWANQRVEVFLVISPSLVREAKTSPSITAFLDRWHGFLKGHDPDQLRAQYLQEKYG